MALLQRLSFIPVLYVAFVFVQSLFFKFTNNPETQYIFGTLNAWAKSLGAPGVFARNAIFSQYVIGTAELAASVILLLSLLPRFRELRPLGAALGLAVISGAIFFHLFTPLGVSVLNEDGTRDGGLLFGLACGVWICCALLLWLDRAALVALAGQRLPRTAS